MSTPTRARFTADMITWLERRIVPPGTRIDPLTPLFADGLVDSIGVLKLIAWTERAIARPIADREIRMENFRTVARIAEVFVPEEPPAPGGRARPAS